MKRNLVDKPNGALQEKSGSARNTNGCDNINEVYIIRVVVKDREENNMSTLAKDKSGGYYMKIRGFEVPKDEMKNVIDVNEISGYDSLC